MVRPFEFYETLPGLTRALLVHPLLQTLPGSIMLDPCVGEGAITEVVRAALAPGVTIRTNDIDRKREADTHADATTAAGWHTMIDAMAPARPAWVITNPPFSVAHKILPRAYAWSKEGVAFMLPLRFMEPTRDRVDVLRRYPWTGQITVGQPRPSFTRDGRTDSVTVFWAIWRHGRQPMWLTYAIDPEGRWQDPQPLPLLPDA